MNYVILLEEKFDKGIQVMKTKNDEFKKGKINQTLFYY